MSSHSLIANAVRALAHQDDGAVRRDNVGFNGGDTKFGNQLAKIPDEAWTDEMANQAWHMLGKYRDQLQRLGIDFSTVPEPVVQVKSKAIARGVKAVDISHGHVVAFIPYGDSVQPKGPLKATWNRDIRGWVVDVSKYGAVLGWAEANNVPVSDRAKALLNEVPQIESAKWKGEVVFRKGNLIIAFDYDQEILDAIRTIPERRFNADEKTWVVPAKYVMMVKEIASRYRLFLTEDVKRLHGEEINPSPIVSAKGENFTITFNFQNNMVSQIRQMPGSYWVAQERVWVIPVESVQEIKDFIAQHDAVVTKEAELLLANSDVVAEIIEASQAHDAEIDIKGFGDEQYKLFPFQRAGVAYAMRAMGYEHNDGEWKLITPTTGGVLVGDEMGLGKTPQGLAIVKAANAFPAVIVVPASLKLNWEREAKRWIKGVKVAVLGGTTGDVPEAEIYIINYDVLTHWVDKFPPIKALVLDESHYIKNGSAQRSKACVRLSDKVVEGGIRICLSGTPIVNQPTEIVTQLRVINRLDDFGGATKFRNTYGNASSRSLAALNRKLRSTCYVRRRKADVLTELPPKRWSQVFVEGNAKVMTEYREAEADIVNYLADLARELALQSGATDREAQNEAWRKALKARAAEQLVAISTLKQLAAKAKMESAREWIENFVDGDKKLVVFGWHRSVVDDIATNFSNGVKIQGGLTPEKRQEAVDAFQTNDDQRVIACNIKAAGVGLTLTAASDVLFLEQGWTPSDMEQAVDRCHRIGQRDSVTGWLMLCANTIDEDIAVLIDNKRSIVNRAIDGSSNDEEESTSIVGDLLVSLAERGLNK
jgi:hypothetical protein